jgi:hypothetical protein
MVKVVDSALPCALPAVRRRPFLVSRHCRRIDPIVSPTAPTPAPTLAMRARCPSRLRVHRSGGGRQRRTPGAGGACAGSSLRERLGTSPAGLSRRPFLNRTSRRPPPRSCAHAARRRAPAVPTITLAAMADDELAALRRITQRRQRAEGEWRKEIRRLFEAGHSIEEIAAAAGVRYDVVLAMVRPS